MCSDTERVPNVLGRSSSSKSKGSAFLVAGETVRDIENSQAACGGGRRKRKGPDRSLSGGFFGGLVGRKKDPYQRLN